MRDFAKALGLPPGEIERLARSATCTDPTSEATSAATSRRRSVPRARGLAALATR